MAGKRQPTDLVAAKGLDLILEVSDILVGEDRGMLVVLDRELLRGQSESVPPHRMEDVVALHPLHAADDIRRRVAFGVADVKALPRGIREHVQSVVFGLGKIMGVAVEGRMVIPIFPPFRLNLFVVVVHTGQL